MSPDTHPQDRLDALEWALQQLRYRAPQGGYEQLDRNRLHVIEQLRDEARREARG